jgi:hypothetical protein
MHACMCTIQHVGDFEGAMSNYIAANTNPQVRARDGLGMPLRHLLLYFCSLSTF